MKYLLIALNISVFLFSCQGERGHINSSQVEETTTTPEALQDDKISSSSFKRYRGDIVNEIFNEEVEKDKGLQNIEARLEELRETKSDSLKNFKDFDDKNREYYMVAGNLIRTHIRDSTLKKHMLSVIEKSEQSYKQKIANHTRLTKLIDSNSITIGDLYMVLKIERTLPLMETYQNEHKPPTSPMVNYKKSQDEVIKMLR